MHYSYINKRNRANFISSLRGVKKHNRRKYFINSERYKEALNIKLAKLNQIRINNEKLLEWKYIVLNNNDIKLIKNKNFLNNQNYIWSNNKEIFLFFHSKWEINFDFKNWKALINKINIEDFYNLKFLFYKKISSKINYNKYKIFIWKKYFFILK